MKTFWKLLLACYISLHQLCAREAAGDETLQASYYSLISELFSDYRREVRPTLSGQSTKVHLLISLISILGLDEKNQILETSVNFFVQWKDPWLTWNATNWNIDSFRYPQNKLWLPDITVFNSVERQSQMGFDEMPVRIDSDGTIQWSPTEIIRTSCDFDVTYYPFDTQNCSIILTTLVSNNNEIDLEPIADQSDKKVDLSLYSKSGTWDLVSTGERSLPDLDELTRIEFSLTLKRLRTYYVVNIIMPVLFLSFTASMVFYLPADAGEKMGMSITVLLAFAVYLTIVADKMPQTSLQTSLLSVYLTLLLAVAAKGVLMSVVILNIHHRPADDMVGKRATYLTRKLRSFLCLNRQDEDSRTSSADGQKRVVSVAPCQKCPPLSKGLGRENHKTASRLHSTNKIAVIHDASSPDDPEDLKRDKVTWQEVAITIDRLCFVVFSIFITVVTLILWAIIQ